MDELLVVCRGQMSAAVIHRDVAGSVALLMDNLLACTSDALLG
jgi:hypothetical protein